jgi:hypothetical protein
MFALAEADAESLTPGIFGLARHRFVAAASPAGGAASSGAQRRNLPGSRLSLTGWPGC